MTRAQRRTHLFVWLVLGPLVLGAFAWALFSRRAPPPTELPGVEDAR
jgi:hypothetical protein